MSTATNNAAKTASARRIKLAMIAAAVVILLPGLVMAILYSRHKGPAVDLQRNGAPQHSGAVDAIEQKLLATGDLNKAADDYRQLIADGSRDDRIYGNLAAVYARLGQYDKAIACAREAIRLSPGTVAPYATLAVALMAWQQPEDARDLIHRAMVSHIDAPEFHSVLYALALLSPAGPDKPAMADRLRWFAGRPADESYGQMLESNTAAFGGHQAKARDLAARAVDTAQHSNRPELPGAWQASAALREAAFGNDDAARKQAEQSLKLAPASAEVKVRAALVLAMIGDSVRAESLAQDVSQRFPGDTQLQGVWLPAIRAEVMLAKKNPEGAIAVLNSAVALELGESAFGPNPSCMYTTYLRGEAYLADEKGTAAATQFQKILDHEGVVWNCWTGALAHLGLARAFVLEAQESEGQDVDDDRLKGLMAYKDFLRIWKDADPDIPILTQAKDELANMQ